MNKLKRLLALAIAMAIVFLAILNSVHAVALLMILLGIPAAIIVIRAIARKSTIRSTSRAWNHPVLFSLTLTLVLSATTCGTFFVHGNHISEEQTLPREGDPWREGLVARVYWNEQPSNGLEEGFADTVRLLGFKYDNVASVEDANIRMWLNSWAYQCKWLNAAGLAFLDPNPSSYGSETGDIYICKFTTPFKDHPITDYSTMAHETAHLLAAQWHFGSGLMGKGGGDGSPCFSEKEIRMMCDKIETFHLSVRAIGDNSNGHAPEVISEDAIATPPCGSQELRPRK